MFLYALGINIRAFLLEVFTNFVITGIIIIIKLGEDNESSHKPHDIVQKIVDSDIIIDSFVVGDKCLGLKAITLASGIC